MALGDSKTANSDQAPEHWTIQLPAQAIAASGMTADPKVWRIYNTGSDGLGIGLLSSIVGSLISARPTGGGAYGYVLVNIGVNDMGVISQASYENALATILDSVHAALPSALVVVDLPWKRGFDTASDNMAGWIATVVAARSSFASLGADERVWLKGADNGVTNSDDGVHYNTIGHAAAASAKLAALP